MRDFSSTHYRTDLVDGVTVFRILDREVRDPDHASDLFRDVKQQAQEAGLASVLIDLSETKHLSGMAFMVMMEIAHDVAASRGRLALCNLNPHLRARAQLLRLQPYVEIYDDESSALASFRQPGELIEASRTRQARMVLPFGAGKV
jgi:anti-anti-sigma regulatory factor